MIIHSFTKIRGRVKALMLNHMHGMITCEQFESFILKYLDNDLPKGQRRVFEWHMRVCRECREYLAAYQQSIELGRAVFSDPDAGVPEDVPEDLLKAILDAEAQD